LKSEVKVHLKTSKTLAMASLKKSKMLDEILGKRLNALERIEEIILQMDSAESHAQVFVLIYCRSSMPMMWELRH
jgi:hypothetical protein